MGHANQCCHLPFSDAKLDINEVRIHWPLVAEQILALRQQNSDLKLASQQNLQKQDISKKIDQKLYKEFITREYCFFGYVTFSNLTGQEELCVTQNQAFTLKQTKKRSSKKQKQNNFKLNFLPTSIRLNDFGILIHREKTCYKGNFRNNKYHGRGYLSILDNQETFEGIFQNGGRVSGTFQNKEIKYLGQFKNDQMDGKGVLKFKKTGQKYEGEIRNGKMHGKGKMSYQNGEFYQGCFLNGLYHGEGKYFWPNGDIFEGAYKKGVKHGFGIMTMNEVSYQLCWVNGKAEGQPVSFKEFKSKKEMRTSKKIIETQISIKEK